MRLYDGSTTDFVGDTISNKIVDKLCFAYEEYYGRHANPAEIVSWTNSLQFVKNLIEANNLYDNAVVLEFELPYSMRRIDVILFGKGQNENDNVVVIELKQWAKAEACDIDGNILTYVGGAKRMEPHPSAQVKGYHFLLRDFLSIFKNNEVGLSSCTYCHNYSRLSGGVLFDSEFSGLLKDFPLFAKEDFETIGLYLKKRLSGGHGLELLNRFKSSPIFPSKKLLEHTKQTIEGNPAFTLIDEQITANNTILDRAKKASKLTKKTVIIVNGGPGTGKSVIALNVLAELASLNLKVFHATGSKSFTTTIQKIVGSEASNLFKYFNTFTEKKIKENEIDVLICDEAHRIRQTSNNRYTRREFKSDMPQAEELIRCSKVSIFFIDDYQVVRPAEIGNTQLIRDTAVKYNADIHEFELKTQFRCSGSDGFLNWIDDVLGVRDTANKSLTANEKMEFKIFESPTLLYEEIKAKNSVKPNSARLVAGYCWKWSDPKPDGTLVEDVMIGDFKIPWEGKEGKKLAKGIPPWYLWAYDSNGVNQCGCIYTIQGFEFEYVGVIVGNDLVYDPQKKEWSAIKENSCDPMVKQAQGDDLVMYLKNIYRTLLTRGMKGCYVYFVDKDTERFFKSRIENTI